MIMKLPPIIRKYKSVSVYLLSYSVLLLVMLSPVPLIYSIASPNLYDNSSNIVDSNIKFDSEKGIIIETFIKQDIRPEEIGFPYTPVDDFSDTGSSFSAVDNLAVDHQFELNLTENGGEINNSYSLDSIVDYSATNIQYNITDITSIKDYYPVEATASAGQFENLKWFNYIAWAQEFEIEWDYAKFYGAKIFVGYMSQFNPGTYELELVLVSANTTTPFAPNATDRISVELDGPYDSTNLLPTSSINNIHYYDFTDVILEKGNYYIIANLSIIDYSDAGAKDYFVWAKHVLAPYEGKTFSMDDTTRAWTQQYNRDLTLIPELLPSDASGVPITFTNPNEIDLKDNGTSITSLTQSISGMGTHVLTSNTSINIDFDNNYEFAKTYGASSIIYATNSSYWDYGIEWNLTWSTPYLGLGDYTNLDRYQIIYTPSDWHDTVFEIYYNDTNTMTSSRVVDGYRLTLNANNNSAGSWILQTTSPNYVNQVELYEDAIKTERFYLGFWTANSTHSVGHVGSNVTAQTLVKGGGGGTPYDETTGSLNYTLYDINGLIIPNKGTLTGSTVYIDLTSYTLAGITNTSAGYFDPTITFDPSNSGTDLPGFWTASVFWKNGTEAGFYSLRIVVQTQTVFDTEWEEMPGSDNWITSDITRKGLDSIGIRTYYYNTSEPYTTGTRHIIPDATVSYDFHNASWSDTGSLNDYAPLYNLSYNLAANVAVGVYTFDLLATGAFLENLTASFDVTVFYELSINPKYSIYQTNYTNNAIYYLALFDGTASVNLSKSPNDMIVEVSNVTDSFVLTSPIDYTFTYQASTEQWKLDLSTSTNNLFTGTYSVNVSIQINDYRTDYLHEYANAVLSLQIEAPKTAVVSEVPATDIYTYHSAVFSFEYEDTNHSVSLTGAHVTASFGVASGVVYNVYTIGNIYYVNITSNNPLLVSISVYVTISKINYETISNFHLGDLTVLQIETSLSEVIIYTPPVIYAGYNTSIVVQYTDTTHGENITGAFLDSLVVSESSVFVSMSYLGNGMYNITFKVTDYSLLNGTNINIIITLNKDGYNSAFTSIDMTLIFIETSADVTSSDSVVIYYDQGTSFEVIYTDVYGATNLTGLDIYIEGNLTITELPPEINGNITIINIGVIKQLGFFYLNITLSKPGYGPQVLTVYIKVIERPTILDTTTGEYSFTLYGDETIEVGFNFTEVIGSSIVYSSNISIEFALLNSTLNINDYFASITNRTFGSYYMINFDAIDSSVVGNQFYIIITFSKYGYVSQNIIIRLIFKPAITYDITVDILGTVQQLETFQFIVSFENFSVDILASMSEYGIHIVPTPLGDYVNITYTFTFANGSVITYWTLAQISNTQNGIVAISTDIAIPWKVILVEYSVTYIPSSESVIISKSSTSSEIIPLTPSFMALLSYLFTEFRIYMIAGLAGLAVIFISLTIYFAAIRPKKQARKAKKRRYLDKISKILTSVISMRKVIVVHNESGLPVFEWDLGGEITVDSSLVSGFLQAVSGMGGEISGGEARAVRKIDYGQFCVSSAGTDCITTYLFSTGDISADIETGISNFVKWFEKRFHSIVSGTWDGITDEFSQNTRQIVDTLSEELFIWTLHPLTINVSKEKDIPKLDSFSQRIYKFMKDYKEVTISVSLEYFNKSPMEETLSKIFELVDNTFLLRKKLR